MPDRRSRTGWVLALTSTAFFMSCLDALVVATALPRIGASLHVGLTSLQWTVNAYNIAVAAGIVCAAALGDRCGRRRVFVGGLGLFTAASAACALAPSAGVLVAARTVQGLGGAVILPLSATILTQAFPPERRAAVLGVYGGLAGLAVAAGPIVGGAVTEGVDWQWIFWLNVPIGVSAALLSARLLPESRGARRGLDLPGVGLATAAQVAVVWGLVRGNDAGWASAETIGSLGLGVVALGAFLARERRTAEPLLDLRLLRVPAFAAGNATSLLSLASVSGGAFLTTQYFQLALGRSPLASGVFLLPFFATPMVVAPVAGRLSTRVGLRPLIVGGMSLNAAGFAWVAAIAGTRPDYATVLAALAVAGVGISLTIPTVPAAVFGSVEPELLGTAAAANTMLQRVGAVVGVALATSAFDAYGAIGTPQAFADGFRPALAAAAVLAAAGALTGLRVAPAAVADEAGAVPA